MALRQESSDPEPPVFEKKDWRSLGWISLVIGTVAIVWGCFAHPEVGNLTARVAYFGELVRRDRVTVAFCVDLLLFWIFQVTLARSHPAIGRGVGCIFSPFGERSGGFFWIEWFGESYWLPSLDINRQGYKEKNCRNIVGNASTEIGGVCK
ncbi:MAG: hypothetical protein AB4290_04685 [Spirulina sp.]